MLYSMHRFSLTVAAMPIVRPDLSGLLSGKVTAKADGSAKLDYDVAHGLVAAPAVWRVTRLDTGEAVKATLVGGDTLRVTFNTSEVAVNDAVALWLWARVG